MKIPNQSRCPGCFKLKQDAYCSACLKKLFDGNKISPVLDFSRPEFNTVKNNQTSRISISGVQVKHSLKLNGRKLELTDKNGEYILKPIPLDTFDNISEMPLNEHLTMQIARQVFKINTAENALIYFKDGEPAYITRRFDRTKSGTKVLQEDFAQLTKRSEESHGIDYKYDGSYQEIADLMKEFVGPYPVEVEKYFDQVVFNYLILNGDAHLKNFSLFRDSGFYRLTPAYDLINTRFHIPNESGDTALELFKNDFESESYKINAFYAKDDFLLFGGKIGMRAARVKASLEKFETRYEQITNLVLSSFLKKTSKDKYLELVKDRVKRLNYSYQESQEQKEENSLTRKGKPKGAPNKKTKPERSPNKRQ